MLAGVYKADVPDFNFSDSPQGLVVDTFYTKLSTDWQFTDIKSLSNAGSIAVISGYAYGGEDSNFKAFLATHPQQVSEIFGDKPLEKSINLLMKGRVDTFIETELVAQYHLMKMGVNNQVRAAGSFKKIIPVYVAFSPALPLAKAQQYKNILTQGVIELRQSGELALILNKYGIQDWVD